MWTRPAQKLKKIYTDTNLATKIRYSYLLLLFPIGIFIVFCFYNLWKYNKDYDAMINSATVASEFSLDFKKDFDYEIYLVIVGNKSFEESDLMPAIDEANRIVEGLAETTGSDKNADRIAGVEKYLKNLEIYTQRIYTNLKEGNKYDENIEIWENDIQIVTSLIRESVLQYIFYEMRDIEQARSEYQRVYINLIQIGAVTLAVLAVIIFLLSYFIPRSITRPIRVLRDVTNQVSKGNLEIRSNITSGADVKVLSDSLNTMIDKINELLDQVKQEQIHLREAELELLQAQINPHFLYNTLDTIIWLAEAGDQQKVVSMVGSLSEFFRTSLNQGKDIITIREELVHATSYLEIQQVRYQDILEYEINVPDSLNQYLIPKITIQPLIENALYHGIKNKRGMGKITVYAERRDESFFLYVEDNGIGMEPERLERVMEGLTHQSAEMKDFFGLYNVNERIRLKFGDGYGLQIQSTYGEGTIVSIKLPYEINV